MFERFKRYLHNLTKPSRLEQMVHTYTHGCYCSHEHMSKQESNFRRKHMEHKIEILEKPCAGIGHAVFIRCMDCDTDWEDATDVGTW